MRPSQGFGEQEKTGPKTILGNREHKKNKFSIYGGTGEQANLFQGNKGTGTPLGGPRQLFCISHD